MQSWEPAAETDTAVGKGASPAGLERSLQIAGVCVKFPIVRKSWTFLNQYIYLYIIYEYIFIYLIICLILVMSYLAGFLFVSFLFGLVWLHQRLLLYGIAAGRELQSWTESRQLSVSLPSCGQLFLNPSNRNLSLAEDQSGKIVFLSLVALQPAAAGFLLLDHPDTLQRNVEALDLVTEEFTGCLICQESFPESDKNTHEHPIIIFLNTLRNGCVSACTHYIYIL